MHTILSNMLTAGINTKVEPVTRFRIICPECGATLITQSPEGAIWETCPQCRRHVWDLYDALMADVVPAEQKSPFNPAGAVEADN